MAEQASSGSRVTSVGRIAMRTQGRAGDGVRKQLSFPVAKLEHHLVLGLVVVLLVLEQVVGEVEWCTNNLRESWLRAWFSARSLLADACLLPGLSKARVMRANAAHICRGIAIG